MYPKGNMFTINLTHDGNIMVHVPECNMFTTNLTHEGNIMESPCTRKVTCSQ